MSRKSKRLLISVVVVVAVGGFLILRGMQNTAVYYLTVGELYAKGPGLYNEGVRIYGQVLPGTVQWDPQKIELRFQMTDGAKTMNVVHHGVAPDMFKEGQEVIVEGKYLPGGQFVATTLLAKCPSKYETEYK